MTTKTATTMIEMEPLNRDLDIIDVFESEEKCQYSWSAEKKKLYDFFKKCDTNHDGMVDLEELREKIYSGDCHEIPYPYQTVIIENDHIQDLDFESFYQIFRKRPWSIKSTLDSYCKWLLPPPPERLNTNRQKRSVQNGVSMLMGEDMADGPYEEEMAKVCPPPVFIFLFSVMEAAVFLSEVWYHYGRNPDSIEHFGEDLSGPMDRILMYSPNKRYEAWRFLTYMFVHKGVSHLCGNIAMQLLLGLPLEVVHKWRIVVVYLCGVLAGSMGTSLSTPSIALVGASAGVYALLTAHLATIFLNWNEIDSKWIQLVIISAYIFFDIASIILTGAKQSIGYAAHLSGGITGILIGIGVLRNLEQQKWERVCWWISIALFVAFMTFGVWFHIDYPNYFPIQN